MDRETYHTIFNNLYFYVSGGFLAQKFVEFSTIIHQPRVVSLFLCNSFTDTSIFKYKDTAVL